MGIITPHSNPAGGKGESEDLRDFDHITIAACGGGGTALRPASHGRLVRRNIGMKLAASFTLLRNMGKIIGARLDV